MYLLHTPNTHPCVHTSLTHTSLTHLTCTPLTYASHFINMPQICLIPYILLHTPHTLYNSYVTCMTHPSTHHTHLTHFRHLTLYTIHTPPTACHMPHPHIDHSTTTTTPHLKHGFSLETSTCQSWAPRWEQMGFCLSLSVLLLGGTLFPGQQQHGSQVSRRSCSLPVRLSLGLRAPFHSPAASALPPALSHSLGF